MSLKETVRELRELLTNITSDIEKADNGNKAASQRVRTGTVRLEKVAKLYRKESIQFEKKNKGTKKATSSRSSAQSKGSNKSSSNSKGKPATSSRNDVKLKPKAKAAKIGASARPLQLSFRKATAKIPTRRAAQ